ncbi:MAG: imidazolonepropionase [Deltaproteobacteria bacterium]|nr:imidazolonepropionase [Deltaproteobacteria bacterium]
MDLALVQHGTALRVDGRVFRLKELLEAEELRDGALRLQSAHLVGPAFVRLRFADGREVAASLPGRDASPDDGRVDLLIHNAGQVLTFTGMGVGLVSRAQVLCQGRRVLAVLPAGPLPVGYHLSESATRVDAAGGVVTPGLVDPHTHLVFAGERSLEFAMKAEGKSYLELHQAGGGIHATVRATRSATFDELQRRCCRNLSELLDWGVTTCEAKSGYALEVEGELRLLEVLRAANNCHPVEIVPTLLGAHALPAEHAHARDRYVEEIAAQMIPRAAEQGLARYCDAYCEAGAFSPEEVEPIFVAARAAGLGLRLHAEQFSDRGGAALGARLGATTIDHLEHVGEAGVAAMAAAGSIAVLLPGAALTCRCPWPRAELFRRAQVPMALGTDLNPGSSMTAALPLQMFLACTQVGMTCDEAWRAVTCVAADSVGRPDLGRIGPGSPADLIVFDVPDYRHVPYHYGRNHAQVVIKAGRVVRQRASLLD